MSTGDWRSFLRSAEPRQITIEALATEYLDALSKKDSPSLTTIRDALRPARAAFGDILASEVRPAYLEAWIEAQRVDGAAPKTIAKRITWVTGLLEYGRTTGALDVNPARLITRPGQQPRDLGRAAREVLTREQANALINSPAIPFERRLLWAVLLMTGARIGEAAGAEWRDIGNASPLPELVLRRQHTKAGKTRERTKTGAVRCGESRSCRCSAPS
jgi:integrase